MSENKTNINKASIDKKIDYLKSLQFKDKEVYDDIVKKKVIKQTTTAILNAERKFNIMFIFSAILGGLGGAGIMGIAWKFYG